MPICFFIGHRDTPDSVMPLLESVIERHIVLYSVNDFIVGNHGSFDRLVAQALRKAKQHYPEIRLTLLLAYYNPDKAIALPAYFDDSLYPNEMEYVPARAAIIRANKYMIQHSHYLIAYDRGSIGNTRNLVKYAQHRAEKGLICIENLANQI